MRAGDVNIKLTADIMDLQAKMQQAGGSIDTLAGRLDQLVGYGLAGGGLYAVGTAAMAMGRALYEASAQAERLRTQLDFATGGQSTRELAMVGAIANKLGLEINATAGAYAGFASAARGTALEGDGARSVFEAMAKAAAVMGLSQDQASGALLAVQQMMSKGIVSAEEFRGQLGERMPIASEAAARAIGVTTAEFNKMLESGQIVAADFLPKFADAMNTMLGDASEKAAGRLDASVTRMGNAWTALKQSIGDSGISRGIASMVDAGAADLQVMAEAIDRAKRSGSGFFGQMNDGMGALIGRTLLLQGVSRDFMTLDQAVADAKATIAALDAQERTQGKLSIYQMDERARAARDLARANAELAASGRVASATTSTQEGMKAQGVAREAWMRRQVEADNYLADTRGKLNGVSKEYTDTLAKLQQLRDQGLVGESEYVSLVTDLANKHGKAAKAVKDHGDAFSAQRDAAKEWASAIERLQGIQADAEGQATGYSKAQQAVVEVFKSPAFLAAPASWKAVFVATAEAAIAAEQQAEAQKRATEVVKEANKAHADLIAGLARSAQGALDQADKLQIEEQAAALAARQNVSLAVAIEQVSIARLREKQVEMLGNEDAVLAIQREIDARTRLIALQGGKDGRAASDKSKDEAARRLEAYLNKDIGTDFAAGFDKASQSLGVFVQQLSGAVDLQAKYQQALQDAGGDSVKIAAVQAKNARAQLTTYAAMSGAAKGFFREGSRGYKSMEAAEKVFRAFELGQAIANAAKQIGLIQSVTAAELAGNQTAAASAATAAAADAAASQIAGTAAASAAVAGQGAKGDPYSAWARMAAMAAAMAALGFAVGGGGGGGSKSTYVTGSGTTLGDRDAASTSIADSIDRLTEVDTLTMQYSGQMLAALRSIDAGINGLGSQVLRDIGGGYGSNLATDRGTLMSLGANLMGLVFSQARAQTVGEIRSNGLALQDTQATNNAWQATWSATRNRRSADAAAAAALSPYADDFESVILRIGDSLQNAAGPLGLSVDQVAASLAGATVQLDLIVTRDKSGEEIAAAIAAQLSKAGDQIASQALPGFERFQSVGEAYYETITRVASGVEEARAALAPLNLTMAELASVAGGAGDVGAELTRNSIAMRESTAGVLSSVGRLVDGLDGSAAELAESYAELVDARRTLGALGVQASALTTGLLAAAGGLDGLSDSLSAYSDWALTDGERLALATQALRDQFGGLGLTLPATVADYRALVAGIDTSTEAGQRLLGQVLGLADGYGELASAQQAVADERAGLEEQLLQLQGDTAALRARELDGLDASNRALQQRIWALQDEQERLDALASAGKGINSLIEELRGGAGSSTSLAQRRAAYMRELQAAQGGDISASESIASTARTLIDALKANASDPLQLALETARIASQLQALPAIAALQQQAGEQASAAISAASTSSQAAASAAAAAASGAPSTTSAAQASTATELQALRSAVADLTAEVQRLRSGQESGLASIAANTGRAARLLDDLTDDGQSLNVRVRA